MGHECIERVVFDDLAPGFHIRGCWAGGACRPTIEHWRDTGAVGECLGDAGALAAVLGAEEWPGWSEPGRRSGAVLGLHMHSPAWPH